MNNRTIWFIPVMILFLASCASLRKGSSRFDSSQSIYVQEETQPARIEVKEEPAVREPAPEPAVVVREERVTTIEHTGPDFRYYVIIGSFRVLENARNFRTDLVRQQFNPVILENEEGLYRVSVAAYNDEFEARSRISQIRRNYQQYSDVWLLIRRR
ncbi:SPOR domain-containing protein [Alkalitalea saponilacus]|uniref:Sporulation related domain-containing protein n=1 Tax=Alkalitalea saponilacus TaxID=889453 RepID=A0A1T5H1B4_9BACT|nr:SPOR domain-containing protein [Alkalitalea saponilacus]ASB50934.1 sporulation protein [Alkalitalea saponilacus]SKC14483.1 Sporulation related domain-containing protein [Alkalitalea saponilacus]